MQSLVDFFEDRSRISILDVGAALLEPPAYQGLIDAGVGRLFGFEPDREACARLSAQYGEPHRMFACFAGDGREATYHETNWGPTGSLYPPNSPLLEKFQNLADVVTPVATHRIETVRIDDIAEIDDVDFIKIDVQGAELDVLRNARKALTSTLFVQTEVEFVELYKGQPLFAEVDIFLRSQGFKFHAFAGFGSRAFKPLAPQGNINAGFRQTLWADAIYARDWMHLEELPARKLQNYAVLAHDLFNSYDLAHLVLAALDRLNQSALSTAYVKRLTG